MLKHTRTHTKKGRKIRETHEKENTNKEGKKTEGKYEKWLGKKRKK